MLKIHSFLHRITKPVSRILPAANGKCKLSVAIIIYMLITVLFLLSPDYIYGTESNKTEALVKKETAVYSSPNIVEETANEAIVRNLKNLGFPFILCDLTTDGGTDSFFIKTTSGSAEGTSNNTINISNNTDSEEKTNLIKQTDSKQAGEIVSQADSGSAKEKETKETVKTAEEAKTETAKKSDGTKTKSQETDSKEKKKNEEKKKYIIETSDNDIEILQRIVEAEATGEDIKGKILVADVIINRVKDDGFPDTVEAVVFQKSGNTYQFSPIKDKRYWSVKVTKETKEAVERALQGEDYSEGALYFSARSKADKSSMSWFDNNLNYLFRYGGHEFFR